MHIYVCMYVYIYREREGKKTFTAFVINLALLP